MNKTNLAAEAGYGGTTWTTYYADPATIGTDHLGFLSGLPSSYHEQYQLFQNVNRFTGSVAVNHRPFSWFNQRLVLGIDNGYEDGEELSAVHHDLSDFFGTDADSGFQERGDPGQPQFTASYVGNVMLPVTSSINSTTSIGGDVIKRDGKYVNGSGSDFPAPGLSSLSSTTAARTSTESDTLDNTVGVFAQEELAWRDRVFITGGVRLDNNSSFGSKFRNVYYPKVSGAWVLSEEPFFHLPAVNTLKLRAAYGESGQAPLPYSSDSTSARCRDRSEPPSLRATTEIRISAPSAATKPRWASMPGFPRSCRDRVHVLLRWDEGRDPRGADRSVTRLSGDEARQRGRAHQARSGARAARHSVSDEEHRMDARPEHLHCRQQGDGSERRRFPAGVYQHPARRRISRGSLVGEESDGSTLNGRWRASTM